MNARPLAAILIFIAAAIAPLIARQTANTTVEFKVTDIQGAGIRGAEIHISPLPDPTTLTFETNAEGIRSVEVSPGTYNVSILASGFSKYSSLFTVGGDSSKRAVLVKMNIASIPSPVVVEPNLPSNQLCVGFSSSPNESAVLSLDDLRKLPHTSITFRNPDIGRAEHYSGVLLLDVLTRTGAIHTPSQRYWSRTEFVVARGNSGDGAIFGLLELNASTTSGEVIVADSLDGEPLNEKLGPLRLIVANDKSFARSVRNLNSIRLDYAR
jgi:hypothetical protein